MHLVDIHSHAQNSRTAFNLNPISAVTLPEIFEWRCFEIERKNLGEGDGVYNIKS